MESPDAGKFHFQGATVASYASLVPVGILAFRVPESDYGRRSTRHSEAGAAQRPGGDHRDDAARPLGLGRHLDPHRIAPRALGTEWHLAFHRAYGVQGHRAAHRGREDRKSTRLNSSHGYISYAVFCLKKKKKKNINKHIINQMKMNEHMQIMT